MNDELILYQSQLDFEKERAEIQSVNFQSAIAGFNYALDIFSVTNITNQQIKLEFKRIDSALEAFVLDTKARMVRYEVGVETIKSQINMLSRCIERLLDKAFDCDDVQKQNIMMEQVNKLTEKLTILTAQLL